MNNTFRYTVQETGAQPESGTQYTNKARAIQAARQAAKNGTDISVYDWQHPDSRGTEYARRIWHSANH